MWQAAIVGFLAGVFGANGVPHFVKGITKESYPCVLGNSPIPNLIGGWGSFVLAAVFLYQTNVREYPLHSMIFGAVGVLLMGLFHAAGWAFGRKS